MEQVSVAALHLSGITKIKALRVDAGVWNRFCSVVGTESLLLCKEIESLHAEQMWNFSFSQNDKF